MNDETLSAARKARDLWLRMRVDVSCGEVQEPPAPLARLSLAPVRTVLDTFV